MKNEKSTTIFSYFVLCVTFGTKLTRHYDFGKDRNYVTTTFEMFKLDDGAIRLCLWT